MKGVALNKGVIGRQCYQRLRKTLAFSSTKKLSGEHVVLSG